MTVGEMNSIDNKDDEDEEECNTPKMEDRVSTKMSMVRPSALDSSLNNIRGTSHQNH